MTAQNIILWGSKDFWDKQVSKFTAFSSTEKLVIVEDLFLALPQLVSSAPRTLVVPEDGFSLEEENLARLHSLLSDDPMLACCAFVSSGGPDVHRSPIPRSLCLLLRTSLIEEFLEAATNAFADPREQLLGLLLIANQVGYGVLNVSSGREMPLWDPLHDETLCRNLEQKFPGLEEALKLYRARYVQFSSCKSSSKDFDKPHILLDFFEAQAVFNGTSEAGLQILSALLARDDLRVSVLVQEQAKEFFRLSSFSPKLTVFTATSEMTQADLVCGLTQPTSFSQLVRLRSLAPRLCFVFYDSIAYDCLQIRRDIPMLEAVWRATAKFADMLIFPSNFSKQIFTQRFSPPESTDLQVCHLSLSPDDYLATPPGGDHGEDHPALNEFSERPYSVVLGNQYYIHKGIPQTIELLGSRFPEENFYALGLSSSPFSNVQGLLSGKLSWQAISRLIAGAKLVIIPSFYEGFGLPLFHALSRNKLVLARESELLDELLPEWRGPGQVLRYRSTKDLGDKLSIAFTQNASPEPLEWGESQAKQRSWNVVADEMAELFLTLCSQAPNLSKFGDELVQLFGMSTEVESLDHHLRLSIAERDRLRSENIRYDENLSILLKQRERLEVQLEETTEALSALQRERKKGPDPYELIGQRKLLLREQRLRSWRNQFAERRASSLSYLRRRLTPSFLSTNSAASTSWNRRFVRLIHDSGLFDDAYYLAQYADVLDQNVDPLFHFVLYGGIEQRNPNPLFDTEYYLQTNPDVARSGINPLAHFLLCGAEEGRNPTVLFDTQYYLRQNPDVVALGMNPLLHYIRHGASEGRSPHPLYSANYLQKSFSNSVRV